MLTNLIRITLRQMARAKTYTTINIMGLGIGLAVCFLIFMWVRDELQYDQFHAHAGRIYRVLWEARYGENEWKIPLGPVPIATALEREFPEVEKATQLYKGGFTVKQGQEYVREQNVLFIDKNFFEVFSLEFVSGNPEKALAQPDAILLTEEACKRYFGDQNPVGRHIARSDGELYQVNGVVKAFPRQSHLQFDFLASIESLPRIKQRAEQWGSATVYNYFLLRPDASIESLQEKWQAYTDENVAGEEFRQGNNFTRFPFQALADIHLGSHLEYELSPNGNKAYVYIFSIVAVFILLLACINFINLATARSLTRGREVGVRKVLGSSKGQLFWRFFRESFFYVILAVGLSLILVQGVLPWFNHLAGKELSLGFLQSPFLWLLLPTAMAAVCVPVAMVLRSRRDLGAGLLTDRAGPSQGKLSSVSGLAWRLQRTVLISWAVGFAAFGFLLGSISDSVTGFLDSPQAAEYLQKLGGTDALADAFLAAELAIMGVLVAAYGIEAASRLHGEEEDGHAEVLLATSVSRGRWAASHLVIALLGVAGVLFVGGLAVGLGAWVATGDAGQVGALAVAALSKVPAAWVLTGLLFLLFGWLPRAVPVIWGVFAVAVVVGEFGPLWDAPQWVMNLSPFVHSPGLPAPNASLVGLVPLTLTAVVLLGLGFVGWRRRDLTTP